MNIYEYLCENFFLFKDFRSDDLAKIMTLNDYSIEKATSGKILHSSDSPKKIGIILKGRAVIKSSNDGVIIRKLASGDLFGVASLFDTATYLTYVVSSSNVEIIYIDKDFIEKCINSHPSLAKRYISFLSQRISFLNSKISAYTAKSAENKLYAFLLQQPRHDNNIELLINMATIAKMIGVGRATLYRAFEKLEQQGLIIKNDKNITLCEA